MVCNIQSIFRCGRWSVGDWSDWSDCCIQDIRLKDDDVMMCSMFNVNVIQIEDDDASRCRNSIFTNLIGTMKNDAADKERHCYSFIFYPEPRASFPNELRTDCALNMNVAHCTPRRPLKII